MACPSRMVSRHHPPADVSVLSFRCFKIADPLLGAEVQQGVSLPSYQPMLPGSRSSIQQQAMERALHDRGFQQADMSDGGAADFRCRVHMQPRMYRHRHIQDCLCGISMLPASWYTFLHPTRLTSFDVGGVLCLPAACLDFPPSQTQVLSPSLLKVAVFICWLPTPVHSLDMLVWVAPATHLTGGVAALLTLQNEAHKGQ
jgi:hypothetical protein